MLQEHEAMGDLLEAARVGLGPAPFPPRRDLEYVHVQTRATRDAVLFHDAMWLRQTRFACFVVRLRGASLPRNLAMAHLLRSLLRAALRKHDAASTLRAGVDCLREFDVAPQDLSMAALKLCVDSGEMSLGATGCDAMFLASTDPVGGGQARDARSRRAQLKAGQRVGLVIGESGRFEPMVRGGDLPANIAVDRVAPAGLDAAAFSLVTLRGHRPSNAHTFTLTNDVAEIGPVLDDVWHCLRAQGIEPDGLLGLDVALDELLTNTILYAYRDGGAHEIVIDVRVHDVVYIEIKDDGVPFDPTRHADADTTSGLDDRPIGGLGLHLVRSVFDTLTYRRIRGWNALTLTLAATPDRAATGTSANKG